MKLREYVHSYPVGKRIRARTIIANALQVTEAAVRSWENGLRNPTPQHAIAVEELTDGKVSRKDLRPDIFD